MIMGKVLFLFITAVLLCGWGVNASVLSDNYVYKEIIIKENDTLWDIAAKETITAWISENTYIQLNG